MGDDPPLSMATLEQITDALKRRYDTFVLLIDTKIKDLPDGRKHTRFQNVWSGSPYTAYGMLRAYTDNFIGLNRLNDDDEVGDLPG